MAVSDTTKLALADALKELMAETPFQKISVVDICDRCGMNRKSFYYHFQDKYDLVNWVFYSEFVIPRRGTYYGVGWQLLSDLFNYFYDNKDFYKNAMSVEGQNSFREYFGEVFTPVAREYLKDVLPHNKYEDITTEYFVSALLVATMTWLNSYDDISGSAFFSLVKNFIVGFSRHVVKRQDESESRS